jgi:hypothetical protein
MAKAVKESAAPKGAENTTTALVPVQPATSSILSSIVVDGQVDISKFERKNLPPMITPDEVPTGGKIIAEIIKFVPSPVTTVKGNLIWMRSPNGIEFMFPCTGVIRSALAPGRADGETAQDRQKLADDLTKQYAGKGLYLEKTGTKANKKGGKNMFMFDVRVTAK